MPSGGRGRKFTPRSAQRDDRRTQCGPKARAAQPRVHLLTPTNYFLIYHVLKYDSGYSIAKSAIATTGSIQPKVGVGCCPHSGPANPVNAPSLRSSSGNCAAIGTCQGIMVRVDLFFFSLFSCRFSFGLR